MLLAKKVLCKKVKETFINRCETLSSSELDVIGFTLIPGWQEVKDGLVP